jgi:hypothetical protein
MGNLIGAGKEILLATTRSRLLGLRGLVDRALCWNVMTLGESPQTIDNGIARPLNAGLAGFHVADGRLLKTDLFPNLPLGKTSLPKSRNRVRDIHGPNYGNSGKRSQPVFRFDTAG